MKLLVYITLFAIGLSRWSLPINDPDLGWQLLGGQWIIENQALPSFDFINALNSDWHDYHWLAQILLYKIYFLGGFELLKFTYGLFMAIFFCLIANIFYTVLGSKRSLLLWALLSILSCFLLAYISSIRPQMLALLGVAISLRLLISPAKVLEPPLLLLITIILVNLHVYWLLIPALWFCLRVLPGIFRPKKRLWYAWPCLVLLAFAGFISPYGQRTYLLIYDYLLIPNILKESVAEFRGSLTAGLSFQLIIVVYFIILARSFKLKRFLARPGEACLIIASPLLAIWSVKYISLLAITGLPFLGRFLQFKLFNLLQTNALREIKFLKVTLIPIALIAISFSIIKHPWSHSQKVEDYFINKFAFEECRFLANLDLTPSHNRTYVFVLTNFNQGGWCRWVLKQAKPDLDIRISMDGRTQYIPAKRYQQHFDLFMARGNWENSLEQLAPDFILVPKNQSLSEVLKLKPNWQLLYVGQSALIFSAGYNEKQLDLDNKADL